MSTPSPCTFQPSLDIYGAKFMADDFWNSSNDNLTSGSGMIKPIHYRSRNELDELTVSSVSKNDSLRKNEEPIYARRKKLSQSFDFESQNNDGNKKLHYFDYNQQRKYSDESFKKKLTDSSMLRRNGGNIV